MRKTEDSSALLSIASMFFSLNLSTASDFLPVDLSPALPIVFALSEPPNLLVPKWTLSDFLSVSPPPPSTMGTAASIPPAA